MATVVAAPPDLGTPGNRRGTAVAAGAIAATGVVACTLSMVAPLFHGLPMHVRDQTIHAGVAAVYIGAGVIALVRRPGNRTGYLMATVGFLWLVGDLGWVREPWAFTIAWTYNGLWEVALAHLALAFPRGRLEPRLDRRVITAIYAWSLVTNAVLSLFYDPARDGCPQCPENLLMVRSDPDAYDLLSNVFVGVTMGLVVLVVALIAVRWRRATRAARHVMAPVFLSVGPAVVYVVLYELGDRVPLGAEGHDLVYNVMPVFLALLPIGFLVGLLRTRLSYAQMATLVRGPGGELGHGHVRDTLARVLHDPDLELLYWSPSLEGYVDLDGRPRDLDAADGRVITRIEADSGPLAALVVDGTALDEPALLDSATAMARLALENERLAAEVRSQLVQLRSATGRLVAAGQDARRKIERDLHDGAQQRLLALSLTLGRARARTGPDADADVRALLDEAADELQQTITELRDLARGIHPMLLTQEGLASALRALADRAPLPVTVAVAAPERRFAEPVETTAYYLVSEAVTNAARHSEASQVRVELTATETALTVRVSDDGIGGADLDHGGAGSGLTGLRDRVVAAGGTLHVSSPPGRGTTLVARLPCE